MKSKIGIANHTVKACNAHFVPQQAFRCVLFICTKETLIKTKSPRSNVHTHAAQGDNDGRIPISMYMWDRSMFKELSPWLEQKFPDIDFTFVQSYTTMDYYKDLIARGESMPDIITCLETMQGCAIPELMSLERTRWRMAYESETEDNQA